MLTIYFCLDDNAPVLRYWPAVPKIGDTVALPELGGKLNPVIVSAVAWEGFDDPSVSVFVHRAKVGLINGEAAELQNSNGHSRA